MEDGVGLPDAESDTLGVGDSETKVVPPPLGLPDNESDNDEDKEEERARDSCIEFEGLPELEEDTDGVNDRTVLWSEDIDGDIEEEIELE